MKTTYFKMLSSVIVVMALIIYSSMPVTAKKNESTGYLEIFGKVKNGKNRVDGALIVVYNEKMEKQEYASQENGKFDIKLPVNGKYYVSFSKSGLISKTVQISTVVPSSFIDDEYEYKFNINLPDGSVSNTLSKPVAIIKYYKVYDGFDYDRKNYREMLEHEVLSYIEPEL